MDFAQATLSGRPQQSRQAFTDARNADKRKYKRMLYSERQAETRCYTNDLHDALINKTSQFLEMLEFQI